MNETLPRAEILFKKSIEYTVSVEPRVFYALDIYFEYDDNGESNLVAVISWLEGKGKGKELFLNMYKYLKKLANINQLNVRLEMETTTVAAKKFNDRLKFQESLPIEHGQSKIFSTVCDYLLIQPD